MHPCHFFNSNNNKDFIKNLKKSRMFLRTGFVELSNSWKLIAIHNLVWLNSRPVIVQSEPLHFYLLSWHFFRSSSKKNCFYYLFFSFWWNIEFLQQNINQYQKQEYVIKNCHWNCALELNKVCGSYVWILKCIYLHCNWNRINLISVLSFSKQSVADYICVFRIQSNI